MRDAPPVVVGVDGSRNAMEAVRLGALEAHRRGTRLDLVLAFPEADGPSGPGPAGPDRHAVLRSMAHLALESAATAAGAMGAGEVATRLVSGDPVDVLARASTTAALLCIGTRGNGTAVDLRLGSTAGGIVRATSCPLLVVPGRAGTTIEHRSGVVVGLEDSHDSGLLAEAFAAAEARGADLLALHAWRHRSPGPAGLAIEPFVAEQTALRREEDVLEDALDGWPERHPTVAVRRLVVRNRPGPTLVAASLTAELLVIGHRRRRVVDSLGSVAHAVLHKVGCPLLIVPLGATPAAGPEREAGHRPGRDVIRAAAPPG